MSQTSALQDFLRSLSVRKERIRRGAYLLSFVTLPVKDGVASVTVGWQEKDGVKYLTHSWTAEELYGRMGTQKPRLKKGVCRSADELIRAVLRERGVIH